MFEKGFIFLLLPFLTSGIWAGDWTQWRGRDRNLIVTDEQLLSVWPEGGPAQLWQIDLSGEGYSEPVVKGKILYITGSTGDKQARTGHLYAVDSTTGKILWEKVYGPEWGASYEFARTSPTIVDERIFLVSGLGRVVCLSLEGQELWHVDAHAQFKGRNITWGIADNPLVYEGKVICQPGGPDAAVVALDVTNGKPIWKSTGLSERSAYCSPALLTLNGKQQVVTMLEDSVVGLDAKTGKPLWRHPHRNKYAVHPNTPVLCGENRLFVSSGYRYGSEILEIKGSQVKQVWMDKSSDNHFQGVAFYRSRIFSSGGNKLSCFDPADGREVYTVAGAKKTSFCITPVGMITYDERGGKVMLVRVEPDTHQVVSSFAIEYGNGPHWSSPVVAHGVLYLRRGNGLAAYAIGAK